jgi:hypothetical protein
MRITLINFFILLIYCGLAAQNPIILNQYTADPSARVFGDKIYVYPSHDILDVEGRGRPGWFCMEDYHVFSSSNLTDWTDHGVIISQDKVSWVDSNAYSMWAPDCIYRNGKYYFYFPARAHDTVYGKGFSIGVAISNNPYGPFIPQEEPIKDVHGIDPNVFIDSNGQSYLYWAARNIYMVRLKDNMIELETEPQIIENLPEVGLKEGPWLFERNGIYYLTYPHVQNSIERLEYAIGSSPMGPFKPSGVIMDESPTGCWTDHQSIVKFNEQWYLFYHSNYLSPNFDKNRSICIDSLFFNNDGSIQKVIPSLRGVGITMASDKIQIDRYSAISNSGVSISFLDSLKLCDGWKTALSGKGSWIQYNRVDFSKKKFDSLIIRAQSKEGCTIQLRQNNAEGPVIAELEIPKGIEWKSVKANVSGIKTGVLDLVVLLKESKQVEIDWLYFE